MAINPHFWRNKKVFLTGHTGFKGSWLATWLLAMGAEVMGLSLPPTTKPSLFEQLGLAEELEHRLGDIRDASALADLLVAFQPDLVFHLAAQPLVRRSYLEPVATWETNVMGTIHLLQGLKQLKHPCAAILITTDKCYENREWVYGYRENDPLGGHDPYSSSKAAAELAIASWRNSFCGEAHCPIKIASVRAGNVIGGGDWAEDRIVPDAMRALERGEIIPVRNPQATRPWQHVLEPLSGYLLLAEAIYQALVNEESTRLAQLCTAFNFGPLLSSNQSVQNLVTEILRHWTGEWQDQSNAQALHEAGLLNLVTDKAYHHLGWQPRWNFPETIARTVHWYRQTLTDPTTAKSNLLADIRHYQQ